MTTFETKVGNLNVQELCKDLKNQFYANIPFPIPRSTIEDAVQAFFKFLDEPDSVKTQIEFSIAPQHRRGDIGYKHRDEKEGLYNDNKDFFHYHPSIFEKYPRFLANNSVVNDFMLKAKPIWDLAYRQLKGIFVRLDADFPGTSNKFSKPNKFTFY